MPLNIPIESMSVSEKLEAINIIWSSLAKNPDSIPTPGWHAEELASRTERLASGETPLSDWDEAAKRLDELGQ